MDDLAASLRERLTSRGVREIVEWDDLTEQERVNAYGLCPIHRTPVASRLTVTLDDHDAVHAMHEAVCTTCELESET